MKILTPFKAMRKNCVECSGGSINEPKYCTVIECPLFPYRLGHRPPKTFKFDIIHEKQQKEG